MVLPRDKRRAIAAIYAFARRGRRHRRRRPADAEKRDTLEELHELLDALAGEPDRSASRSRDARERFPIPRSSALHALVDGGLQDIDQSRYADFAELRGYCEKVAGAVGLACVPIYGSDDSRARR